MSYSASKEIAKEITMSMMENKWISWECYPDAKTPGQLVGLVYKELFSAIEECR